MDAHPRREGETEFTNTKNKQSGTKSMSGYEVDAV